MFWLKKCIAFSWCSDSDYVSNWYQTLMEGKCDNMVYCVFCELHYDNSTFLQKCAVMCNTRTLFPYAGGPSHIKLRWTPRTAKLSWISYPTEIHYLRNLFYVFDVVDVVVVVYDSALLIISRRSWNDASRSCFKPNTDGTKHECQSCTSCCGAQRARPNPPQTVQRRRQLA